MNKDKNDPKQAHLEPDPIVERLAPDPSHPDVTKLTGYFLGKSSREEYWRLYLNPGLKHHLEFKKSDTLDAQRVKEGKIIVWLKPEARIFETRTRLGPAHYLEGALRRELWEGGADSRLPGGLQGPIRMAAAGCSAASCFTTAGPNCPGPEHPGTSGTVGYTCGC